MRCFQSNAGGDNPQGIHPLPTFFIFRDILEQDLFLLLPFEK